MWVFSGRPINRCYSVVVVTGLHVDGNVNTDHQVVLSHTVISGYFIRPRHRNNCGQISYQRKRVPVGVSRRLLFNFSF